MKPYFKYLILCLMLLVLSVPVDAKKHKKAKSSKTTQIRKSKKKPSKKRNSTKFNRNNIKKKIDKVSLNALLNETIVTVAPINKNADPDKVITIYSAFKPQLKNVAKISFNNAAPIDDSSAFNFNYQVPSQNLNFQYRPIELVPRALPIEQNKIDYNNASIKLGLGNFQKHEFEMNINAKDKYHNIHQFQLNNSSATGVNHHLQINRNIGGQYANSIKLNDYNKIVTNIFFNQNQKYRYGLVPDSSNFSATNYEQNFQHAGIQIGGLQYGNKEQKINIQPILNFDFSSTNNQASGTLLALKMPIEFQLKNDMQIHFDLSYTSMNNSNSFLKHQINFLESKPTIHLKKWGTQMQIGVHPVWSNKYGFNLYPNLFFQKLLKDTHYLIQTGWNTSILKNHLASLIQTNPWINSVNYVQSTIVESKFVELNVVASKRLQYDFKLGLNDYRNLPLFKRILNTDLLHNGLIYQALFEPRAITIEFDAAAQYQLSDRLVFKNNLKYIQFNSLKENAQAWGILPLHIQSHINWHASKKWFLDGSMEYWTGSKQLNAQNQSYTLKNVMLLNLGFNYQLSSYWSIWGRGENLLDKPYERWGDYPGLGLQIIAGIKYTFIK